MNSDAHPRSTVPMDVTIGHMDSLAWLAEAICRVVRCWARRILPGRANRPRIRSRSTTCMQLCCEDFRSILHTRLTRQSAAPFVTVTARPSRSCLPENCSTSRLTLRVRLSGWTAHYWFVVTRLIGCLRNNRINAVTTNKNALKLSMTGC